jgi:hypothetical protein
MVGLIDVEVLRGLDNPYPGIVHIGHCLILEIRSGNEIGVEYYVTGRGSLLLSGPWGGSPA